MRLVDVLSDALRCSTPPAPRQLDALRLRTVVVEGATATTCTVQLDGASIPDVPILSSYTPTVGDIALVLQQGSQLVAVGRAR